MKTRISGYPGIFGVRNRRLVLSTAVWISVFLLLVTIVSDAMPLTGALFRIGTGGVPPTSGIYVSRNYEAQPNERGSIVVQAGQAFTNLEGISFSIAVDPARADILRVRRTAVTQQFDISVTYPAAGIVRIALVGPVKAVSIGAQLLELELNLRDSSVNRVGHRIDVRLLGVRTLSNGNQISVTGNDGLITFVTSQDALTLPFVPFIGDVDPGILPLVRAKELMIRGQAFPASPRVLLGSTSIPVKSASSTEIIALIPENTAPGVYTVSVESLLAEEKVAIFGAPATAGPVDILEELLFFDPNPVLYTPANPSGDVTLWIPVFNPLGENDSVRGAVDLTAIGGDPTVSFSGIGTPAIGPGGERINWFRIPATGSFRLPSDLETNVDYPVIVRAENRAGSTDTAIAILSLRSQIPSGGIPSIGSMETVPARPIPGGDVSFFVDISDADGVDSISLVTIRLTPIGGSLQTMDSAISSPSEGAPLRTIPFTTDFSIPERTPPGIYQLELRAVDSAGNEALRTFTLNIVPPGGQQIGQAPQFSGRLEARPTAVGPGGTVDFFAGVRDPDGTETIDLVTIDLVDVGGGIEEMTPAITSDSIGTLPVTYQTSFDLPSDVRNGQYALKVRAIDVNGLSTETTIALTVDSTLGVVGGGSPPEFQGRKETSPLTVGLGGLVKFFIAVRDIDGSDTIEKVSIDLVDLGGTILELETASDPVGGSIEPVLYTGEYTLPSTVAPGVYTLSVQAFDGDGNASRTTIPVTVSALVVQTNVPVILQALAVPAQVPADNKTQVLFRIEVEDSDGIKDIAGARINLTALGLGIEKFELQSKSITETSTRGFMETKNIKIPTSVKSAGYDLPVEVEDSKGKRAQRTLRLTVGPMLAGDAPLFREARFVPETAQPGGDVRLYVDIEDLNGADQEKLTVVADFTEVRLEIEELSDLINFPSGTLVSRNTFASDTVTLPEDLPVGVYDVPLMVVDDTGNVIRTIARLRVEHGRTDEGQEPRIATERAFQVPRVFANDNDGEGELHLLIQDPDDDVLTVIANLGSVGSADSANVRTEEGDIDLLCRSSSAVVCMERGALEGIGARWFILRNVTIPETTIPGNDPYMIDVTAIDAGGHTVEGSIPLFVGSPEDAEALKIEPTFDLVVPVSSTQLELVLSSPVDARTIDRSGRQFVIRPALDAFTALNVQRVAFDTTGRYLYLTTDSLTPGETYILSVKEADGTVSALTDVRGNRFARDRGGKITFTFSTPGTDAPAIERIMVIDAEHINVRFTTPVLPSSVHPDLLSSRATIVSTVTGETRAIRDGILTEGGRVLKLTVEELREGDRYRLRIEGVLAPGLIEAPAPGAEKIFIALFPRHNAGDEQPIFPTADLNRDGVVDFADFALFSAVYNTEYNFEDIQNLEPRNAAGEEENEGSSFGFGAKNAAGDSSNKGPGLGGGLPKISF